MTTQVIRGSKTQIVQAINDAPGDIVEAILFLDEAAREQRPNLTDEQFEQLLAEMESQAVSVGHADYSRESIYSREEGE